MEEGRCKMIVYLTTQENSRLLDETGVWNKKYIHWKCDIGDFIKKEYANILALHPETIVLDTMAVKEIEKLSLLRQSFPETHIIVLSDPSEQEILSEMGIKLILKDQSLNRNLCKELGKEVKEKRDCWKIGFLSSDAEVSLVTALNFVSDLEKQKRDICLIEVGKESSLQKFAQNQWIELQEGLYKYHSIPILHNAGKSGVEYSIFSFQSEDSQSEHMWNQCDISISVEKVDETFVLKYHTDVFEMKAIHHPIDDDRANTYEKIFGDVLEIVFERKREKKSVSKQPKKRKKINKKNMKRAGIFLFLFFSMGILGVSLMRFYNGAKRKEELKDKVRQEKMVESQATTTSTTVSTEKTTRKVKKSTEHVTTTESTERITTTATAVSTKMDKATNNSTKKVKKKEKTEKKTKTTEKKKKEKNTQKEKKSTTEKQKATEQFDLDYEVH